MSTSDTLTYVYAVVEAGTPAHQALRDGRVAGLVEGEPLLPIERGGLVAAASRVPASRFDDTVIDALVSDLATLAPYALRHDEAIRSLHGIAEALLPLAFGTVYREPGGVVAFLKEREADLRVALDRVRNRDEWGLKGFRDARRFRETVEATSESLRAFEATLRGATPGRAYLLQKQRERRVVEEVERETDRAAAEVFQQLSRFAASARRDSLPAEAATAPRALVLKASFLVERDGARFAELYADLERVSAAWGLDLEITGPWAPYSFVEAGR